MKILILTLLMFFDFFHKKKILKALNKLLEKNNNIIFDVGAHKGESIFLFQKNFISSNFYSFEPLKDNFFKLKKNTLKFKQNINYFNIGRRWCTAKITCI